MIAFGSGLLAALAVIVAARASGFDRGRSFYPTVLVVIALLYVLFGVESGAAEAVAAETVVALSFIALAVVAFRRRSFALLAVGLALHGLWDIAHPFVLPESDGVPTWWPAFCLGVDLPLAAWAFWAWPPSPGST
ncbi:MAG TPA: hypothetical protein EYQ24_11790 [Bacteroidetes bacterium]|nr:hypothetical protein [Bacteroidota bacterium]